MKKLIALLLAFTLIFALAACEKEAESSIPVPPPNPSSSEPAEPIEKKKIGVAMPTQSLRRWNQSGTNLKAQLEAAGYEVDLQFSGDSDIPTQIAQIEAMISGDCDLLVIAAMDSYEITEVVEKAKEKNIPVIAYDRMTLNTDAVSYYVGFDSEAAGSLQGEFIADALDLENAEGPFNIELFNGDLSSLYYGDPRLFYRGLRKVLQPYFNTGKLVVPSNKVADDDISTENWNTEKAQERMEDLVEYDEIFTSQLYGPGLRKLDAVWCANDSIAVGVTNALVNAEYIVGKNFPIVTGSGCEIYNMKNIATGMQSMSLFMEINDLISRTVTMVNSIMNGEEPEVNNTTDYDNGLGTKIPAYLCPPLVCTAENYKELLIDSGYFTENELYEQFEPEITPNPFKPTTD